MTNYERRKKRMAEDPVFAEKYRRLDAERSREYRKKKGVKTPYIKSLVVIKRRGEHVGEQQTINGYKDYVKKAHINYIRRLSGQKPISMV